MQGHFGADDVSLTDNSVIITEFDHLRYAPLLVDLAAAVVVILEVCSSAEELAEQLDQLLNGYETVSELE